MRLAGAGSRCERGRGDPARLVQGHRPGPAGDRVRAEQNPLAAFGLTLTVGGTLVTGTAVGAAAYWTIVAGQDPEDRSGLRGFLLDAARMALEAAETPSDPSSVTVVHLVDSAHWISSEVCIPTDQRALWRGRLSEVQGWTLGWLGEQPEPSTVLQHRAALEALDSSIDRGPD